MACFWQNYQATIEDCSGGAALDASIAQVQFSWEFSNFGAQNVGDPTGFGNTVAPFPIYDAGYYNATPSVSSDSPRYEIEDPASVGDDGVLVDTGFPLAATADVITAFVGATGLNDASARTDQITEDAPSYVDLFVSIAGLSGGDNVTITHASVQTSGGSVTAPVWSEVSTGLWKARFTGLENLTVLGTGTADGYPLGYAWFNHGVEVFVDGDSAGEFNLIFQWNYFSF